MRAGELAGRYAIGRDGYVQDMRAAFAVQMAELEAMLARARTGHEAAPSDLGAERLRSFEQAVERVRAESDGLLARVPDPLGVQLDLAPDGTFQIQIESPGGVSAGRGTWSVRDETVVLLHLEEDGATLETPVTEELAIRPDALEKRASSEHFPFSLRREG